MNKQDHIPAPGNKIGYKVVREIYPILYGSIYLPSGRGLYYFLGEKTTIPSNEYGPMAVFDTIEDTRIFLFKDLVCTVGLRAFKVEYKPSNQRCLWFVSGYKYPPLYGDCPFLYTERPVVQERELFQCPRGTVLADEVTLIEEVKWD